MSTPFLIAIKAVNPPSKTTTFKTGDPAGAEKSLQLPPCDYQPQPYHGPSGHQVQRQRDRYCNPGVFTLYSDPLMLVDGHQQYLFDETGQRYLDLFAGIATVSCGHGHPTVVSRIKDQLDRLQHASTIYLHPNMPELAERLSKKMPPGLEVVYFTNSGSEASELAIAMARLFTGNTDVIGVRNAYHGGSAGAMGLTSLHTWKFPIPQGVDIHHTVCPDPYRSPFSGTPDQIAQKSAADLQDVIRCSTRGRIAAFICEAVQGVGGATSSPPGYLKRAYQITRDAGGLCIADEVQCGFARTGNHFWGFENFGVTPDIVTLAKAFGNGMPLAAVVTRREVAEVMKQKLHFNTFGGNPVAMAAGLGVLEAIEADELQSNARVVGQYFKQQLRELQQLQPLIGDVRGLGLMLGVELVEDPISKAPATDRAVQLVELMREAQILIGRGGLFGNVLRIKPPLCINRQDVDYSVAMLQAALLQSSRS